VARSFQARYSSGRCGICDEPIEEGEVVQYEDDELVHSACADEEGDEYDGPSRLDREIADRYPDWQ